MANGNNRIGPSMPLTDRVTCAPVCVWSMLRFSAAIFLAHPRARANGRCLKSVVVPSDGGRYSYATSAAPQDYPLGTNVPTGKEGNYPFKLDALTISIIAVVLLVHAAFLGCCLRIIWVRLLFPDAGEHTASPVFAAADTPQTDVARGGSRANDGGGGAHITMTAVIQPNDEVAIARRVNPEGVQGSGNAVPHPVSHGDNSQSAAGGESSADSASSVHGASSFKNPLFLTNGDTAPQNVSSGSPYWTA